MKRIDATIALLCDMGLEVRSRREPESILTGAFVAASGAVSWGVAALPEGDAPYFRHPAIIGSIGILILSVAVIAKIVREYNTYKSARAEQGNLAKALRRQLNVHLDFFPQGLIKAEPQKGHLFSICIILISGIASSLFCLSIYFY